MSYEEFKSAAELAKGLKRKKEDPMMKAKRVSMVRDKDEIVTKYLDEDGNEVGEKRIKRGG